MGESSLYITGKLGEREEEGEIDGVSRLKTFLSDSLRTPAAHQTKANEQTGEKNAMPNSGL